MAATTPKERRRRGRRCYARPIPSLLWPSPSICAAETTFTQARPPPRSNWLGPRTRATGRVAPTVQSWHSTVMLSYSRTEGFGLGGTSRLCRRAAPSRAPSARWRAFGPRDGSQGLSVPTGPWRVQEAHSRGLALGPVACGHGNLSLLWPIALDMRGQASPVRAEVRRGYNGDDRFGENA